MENNVKRVLTKRVFAGHYIERRLVNEDSRTYSDVVLLYPDETELADDLAHASEVCTSIDKSAFGSYSRDPPSIWVIPMNVPFGKHWFQISAVEFQQNGICYWLKSLRYFPGVEYPTSKSYNGGENQPVTLDDVKESFQHVCNYILSNMNVNGIVGVLRFIIILITTLITGLFKLVFFTGDFSLKLMKESTLLIDAATPMFLGMLEFISKIIGGFYILIAMMWRGNKPRKMQPDPYGNHQAITYKKYR